ncbi:hypothetical protein ACJX0J_006532 [Zea mays]
MGGNCIKGRAQGEETGAVIAELIAPRLDPFASVHHENTTLMGGILIAWRQHLGAMMGRLRKLPTLVKLDKKVGHIETQKKKNLVSKLTWISFTLIFLDSMIWSLQTKMPLLKLLIRSPGPYWVLQNLGFGRIWRDIISGDMIMVLDILHLLGEASGLYNNNQKSSRVPLIWLLEMEPLPSSGVIDDWFEPYERIWKTWAPPKCQFFLWLIYLKSERMLFMFVTFRQPKKR